jgi:hypothetical protein
MRLGFFRGGAVGKSLSRINETQISKAKRIEIC